MKKRKTKSSSKDKYDTFSITMELERPLPYNEDKCFENKDANKNKDNADKLKKGVFTLISVVGLFVVGFFIWLSNGYELQQDSLFYLESDSYVQVTEKNKNIYFIPKKINATKGFIFYPGERVDSSSYANICKNIAARGYLVVAVDMPFNYPSLGVNKGNDIIEENLNIEKWVIGGDSLGGSAACKLAAKNANIDGVVLISSYPTNNINNLDINVLTISGTKDDVINYKELINSKSKLPQNSQYVEIEGGNHSQFGNYGKFSGDGDPLISADEQISITVENIVSFMNKIQ